MTEVATPLVIAAPAKLNLGLEIVGRRSDGYHELVTIFLAVSLFDQLTISPASQTRVVCDACDIPEQENLVQRALDTLHPHPAGVPLAVTIQKRIPFAAGLGGASSDAAATLLGVRRMWGLPVSLRELAALSLTLGSDVPFFLHGGCALGRGRGELLEPLPLPHRAWFVVVAPNVRIPRKTATLYGGLAPRDFSDGSSVEAQAARLRSGQTLHTAHLRNAFARPITELVPGLKEIPTAMREAGATSIALTGAGPAHYAVLEEAEAAQGIAERLRARLGTTARVFVVAPMPARAVET